MAAMQPIEEVGEEEEEEEVIGQVSHTVNEYITLFQPDLCVIYAWAHWTSKSEDDQGSCIEIKQIVGHALLQLDDDMYDRLDLKDVIDRFHDQNNGLTSAVRVAAERHKNRWVDWIPQLREKYLGMCRKDKKSVASQCLVILAKLTEHLGWLNKGKMN